MHLTRIHTLYISEGREIKATCGDGIFIHFNLSKYLKSNETFFDPSHLEHDSDLCGFELPTFSYAFVFLFYFIFTCSSISPSCYLSFLSIPFCFLSLFASWEEQSCFSFIFFFLFYFLSSLSPFFLLYFTFFSLCFFSVCPQFSLAVLFFSISLE